MTGPRGALQVAPLTVRAVLVAEMVRWHGDAISTMITIFITGELLLD